MGCGEESDAHVLMLVTTNNVSLERQGEMLSEYLVTQITQFMLLLGKEKRILFLLRHLGTSLKGEMILSYTIMTARL